MNSYALLFQCNLTNIILFLVQGSYMLDYFQYLYKYFEVGVPVYFVTKRGFDFTSVEGMNAVCSSVGCDQFSLTQKIQYATTYPDRWVSDFIFYNLDRRKCRLSNTVAAQLCINQFLISEEWREIFCPCSLHHHHFSLTHPWTHWYHSSNLSHTSHSD